MILEVADIRIQPGRQVDFAQAVVFGVTQVIAKAEGFRSWKLNHSIESPERFLLMICWDTLEDHTVAFRGGPLFAHWRAIVGPYFAEPPVVEHFNLLGRSGDTSESSAASTPADPA